MKTIYVKPREVTRKWHLIDAKGKVLGKVAVKAAELARGKHKPLYTPHQEIGDYVIIINAKEAVVTGRKTQQKEYYRHSGYPGGLSTETYEKALKRKPVFPMEHAVRGMLPKGRLGRKLFTNIKVYADERHPHAAQQPETVEV
ncbi:MAG: 50S ribosomal protein L13 [Spirochaetales bacterium]|jgi:large subunit ribosomal protein L13|nr:50S ribosomal protein L13 [Spirochaetales bacterium]